MYRDESIENALVWAYRQSYSLGKEAIDNYCAQAGLAWSEDYQGIVTFIEPSKFINDHIEFIHITE